MLWNGLENNTSNKKPVITVEMIAMKNVHLLHLLIYSFWMQKRMNFW